MEKKTADKLKSTRFRRDKKSGRERASFPSVFSTEINSFEYVAEVKARGVIEMNERTTRTNNVNGGS